MAVVKFHDELAENMVRMLLAEVGAGGRYVKLHCPACQAWGWSKLEGGRAVDEGALVAFVRLHREHGPQQISASNDAPSP